MNFIKRILKKLLFIAFQQGQKIGLDILPRNFYSEIPDLRILAKENTWRKSYSMISVLGANPGKHLDVLKKWLSDPVLKKLKSTVIHDEACHLNGAAGYGLTEADVLFGYVASQRPDEIFQIGCGVSTAVCLMAAEYASYQPKITCVEPYPTKYLQQIENEGKIKLIPKKAQELSFSEIEKLGYNNLFFVDSTHTLGPAGEVTRIILEFLPILQKGSTIHFHDIYFPYDYSRNTLHGDLFFPHESPLLHAFLACNERFSILCSLSMLHYNCKRDLQNILPNYYPAADSDGLQDGAGCFPSATYLQVIA